MFVEDLPREDLSTWACYFQGAKSAFFFTAFYLDVWEFDMWYSTYYVKIFLSICKARAHVDDVGSNLSY